MAVLVVWETPSTVLHAYRPGYLHGFDCAELDCAELGNAFVVDVPPGALVNSFVRRRPSCNRTCRCTWHSRGIRYLAAPFLKGGDHHPE